MNELSANSNNDIINTIEKPNVDQSAYDKAEFKSKQKSMAEKLLDNSEDRINRNIKDSVFCNLFGDQDYLFQLYQALHPEDHETARGFAVQAVEGVSFQLGAVGSVAQKSECQHIYSESIMRNFGLRVGGYCGVYQRKRLNG